MKPAVTALPQVTLALLGTVQRKCACGGATEAGGCEECKKKAQIQRRRASHGGGPASVPPLVNEVLRAPGEPLDASTRAFFEPRFGHDFSKVRVHADGEAAESARAVHALAYTFGHHVVFAESRYAPNTARGQRLLAHELVHVVQQRESANSTPSRVSDAGDIQEQEADRLAGEIDQVGHALFEPHFDRDFSRAHLHAGAKAGDSAADVQTSSRSPAIFRQAGDDQPGSNAEDQQANQPGQVVTNDVPPGNGGQQQPTGPGQTPGGGPTGGRAACPVSATFGGMVVGLGEGKGCNVNCRPATGHSGTGRLAHFTLSGLPAGSSSVQIDEQFNPLEENPQGIAGLLQKGSNTAVNGAFDDCYCIESPNPLPPDFRLKTEQNHLLNGVILDKNQITFTADGIRFCHFDRKPNSCDFGGRCKL